MKDCKYLVNLNIVMLFLLNTSMQVRWSLQHWLSVRSLHVCMAPLSSSSFQISGFEAAMSGLLSQYFQH